MMVLSQCVRGRQSTGVILFFVVLLFVGLAGVPVHLASADTLADKACEEATRKYNEEMEKQFPEGHYPPYVCVPAPDVNTPGGTQGESSTASAEVEESSVPGEDSPKIADVEVEEPAAVRDNSPIPTGPHSDTDEPSVSGAKSRAALQAMQGKEESAKPSGKPGFSHADGMVNTPVGGVVLIWRWETIAVVL